MNGKNIAKLRLCLEEDVHQKTSVKRESEREANKTPKVTVRDLERSTAQTGEGVHGTTTAWTLHNSGLYGRAK